MPKVLRLIITAALALILLFLIIFISLLLFVNPNDLKPQIINSVDHTLHRQLKIEGNIGWSFFPSLGLELKKAELSNSAVFDKTSFAQIEKIDFQIKLLPLLHKQLEIQKLNLNGLTLNLIKNSKGINNWQDLAGESASKKLPPNEIEGKSIQKNLKSIFASLTSVNITNSHIYYTDQIKNKKFEIKHLFIQSGAPRGNNPIPVNVQFELLGDHPIVDLGVKFNTNITTSFNENSYTLNTLQLLVTPRSTNQLFTNTLTLRAQKIDLDFSKETLSIPVMKFLIDKKVISGNIEGKNIFSDLYLEGNLNTTNFQFKQAKIDNATIHYLFTHKILLAKPIFAQFYQGAYTGDLEAKFLPSDVVILMHNQLNHLNLGSFFKEVTNLPFLQGAGNLTTHVELQTHGFDKAALLKNLHGSGDTIVLKGAIKGVDLPYWLNKGKSLFKRDGGQLKNTAQTEFTRLTAHFYINQGIIRSDNLKMYSEGNTWQVQGKGIISNLPAQSIDYVFTIRLWTNNKLEDIGIPVRLSGAFKEINISVDPNDLLSTFTHGKLKESLGEQIKKINFSKFFH